MKKTIAFLLCTVFIWTFLLTGCETNPSKNANTSETTEIMDDTSKVRSNKEIEIDANTDEVALAYMTVVEWIQKISKISEVYDVENTANIFDETHEQTEQKKLIPLYRAQDVIFYPGEPENKSSAYIAQLIDDKVKTQSMLYLALYDFDKIKLQECTEQAKLKSNPEFIKKVELENSSGRVLTPIEDVGTLIDLLGRVAQDSSIETLIQIFGKAPKDISDTQQKKFAYYTGQVTIVFYDAPFSYCEIFVPGGSVKVLLDWEEK